MDEETQEHVRNWLRRAEEYLRAAEYEFNGEFYARTISAAYYAMFYTATGALKSIGEERAKHSGVSSAFGEYFIRSGKLSGELGRMLRQTMEDREKTDYDEMVVIDRHLAQKRLDDARRFVETVKEYLVAQGLT